MLTTAVSTRRFAATLGGLALIAATPLAVEALHAHPARADSARAAVKRTCSRRNHRSYGPVRAKLFAPGHRPHVGNWPIRVTGTSGAYVYYQFLYRGQIVSCQPVGAPNSPYIRHGRFHDTIQWPSRAIGFPLTFRVVVFNRRGLRNLNYAVQVRR